MATNKSTTSISPALARILPIGGQIAPRNQFSTAKVHLPSGPSNGHIVSADGGTVVPHSTPSASRAATKVTGSTGQSKAAKGANRTPHR